jgi:serine/threonine protein kinase
VLQPNKCLTEPQPEFDESTKFDEVYLVLRQCDMDLLKLLKSAKSLEETQVKSIVYDILCALKYMHSAKIMHRDLKPGNILINDDCTIQICDFGLARSFEQEIVETTEECKVQKQAGNLARPSLSTSNVDAEPPSFFKMQTMQPKHESDFQPPMMKKSTLESKPRMMK